MKQKKLISLCLAMVLTFSCAVASLSVPAFGVETSTIAEEDYLSYAKSVAPGYLSLYESEVVPTDLFCISNGFPVFNRSDEEYRAFFVFKNKTCVGLLNVSCSQGKDFASSFVHKEYPVVTTALLSNTSITLYTDGETVWVINNGIATYLSGVNADSSVVINDEIADSPIVSYKIDTSDVHFNTRIPSEYFMPVPIIENKIDPDNGYALCWAACVASICRYYKPARITALSVYKSMKNQYPGETITARYVPNAFEYYGVSMACSESGMDFDEASSRIWAGKPIYASLIDYRGINAHAVVVCGYEHANGNYYYNLMDPNEPNYVSVLLDNPSSNDFTYTSAAITFVEWRRSYY